MRCTLFSFVDFRLYSIFPYYLINGTLLGKRAIQYKIRIIIFSANFGLRISGFKKNSMRHYHIFTDSLMKSSSYFCQISLKFKCSRKIFKKWKLFSNIIFFKYVEWYLLSTDFLKKQNIPHTISLLSEFCRTQNLIPVFKIQPPPIFWNKWILVTSFYLSISNPF